MRLIDADALEEEFIHHHPVGDGGLIAKAPTVTIKEMKDELPDYIKRAMVDTFRPKGKWEYTRNGLIYCNICNHYLGFRGNYCPNCGADMRGDV